MPEGMRRPRNVNDAIETMRKLPTYGRLVWDLARDPRVPMQQKLVLGALGAYLAFPIDIIPDFIPVIGQMDDIAVLLFTLDWFIKHAPPEVVQEHMTRIAAHDDTLSQDLDKAGSLFAGRASDLRATLERFRAKRQGGDE